MPADRPLSVVILAAGHGTRMRSRFAKVLHPLCGRTMLGWTLHAVAPLEPDRVAVVVGFQAEEVTKMLEHIAPEGLPVRAVEQHPQLGTGHALATALAALEPLPDEDVLVLAGDHPLLDTETLASLVYAHRDEGGPWTLISAVVDDPTGSGRVIRGEGGYVDTIVEERDCGPEEAAVNEVSPVMYCIRRSAVEPLLADLGSDNAQSEVYLNAAIDLLDGVVAVTADPEVLRQVNDRVQLAECEAILRRRINEDHMRSGVTMLDPDRTYIDIGVHIGLDTVIYPGVLIEGVTRIGEGCSIGPDVRIIDSEFGDHVVVRMAHIIGTVVEGGVTIGPYVSIRSGCLIEEGAHLGTFVELKKSRVGPNSKVPHLSYVGDATLGNDVNFGAGTITCNWDGRDKHPTTVDDGVRTGSGTMLVAPIRLGKGAYTGAGSVVREDVPDGALAYGVPAKIVEGWAERNRGSE